MAQLTVAISLQTNMKLITSFCVPFNNILIQRPRLIQVIYFILFLLIILGYRILFHGNNVEITVDYVKSRIYKYSTVYPVYNDSDNRQCFKSHAFNSQNKHLKFIDMADDRILKYNNGQNIIFHATNCIHDGIPQINHR